MKTFVVLLVVFVMAGAQERIYLADRPDYQNPTTYQINGVNVNDGPANPNPNSYVQPGFGGNGVVVDPYFSGGYPGGVQVVEPGFNLRPVYPKPQYPSGGVDPVQVANYPGSVDPVQVANHPGPVNPVRPVYPPHLQQGGLYPGKPWLRGGAGGVQSADLRSNDAQQ